MLGREFLLAPGPFCLENQMKKYKHIGWIKYCNTSTSLNKPGERMVEPWPCGKYFGKDKPSLDFQESPDQFFWREMYIKVSNGSNN